MSIRNTVKSIQDIMRKDVGVDGDAQRISQLCWMFFLKIMDDQDQELELLDKDYRSPIPTKLQWRAWAADRVRRRRPSPTQSRNRASAGARCGRVGGPCAAAAGSRRGSEARNRRGRAAAFARGWLAGCRPRASFSTTYPGPLRGIADCGTGSDRDERPSSSSHPTGLCVVPEVTPKPHGSRRRGTPGTHLGPAFQPRMRPRDTRSRRGPAVTKNSSPAMSMPLRLRALQISWTCVCSGSKVQ